jgi:K+-transporting ATPase ATPase C chain
LHDADPDNHRPIPVDLVTASASGLDPDMSVAAAEYQAERVARARHLELAPVEALITAHVRERLFGIIGERCINVLELNRALDRLQ